MTLRTITVDLGDRSYPIFIGENLLTNPEYFLPYLAASQVLVVTNETIDPLYSKQLRQALAGVAKLDWVVLPDGEQFKTLETLNQIFDSLLTGKHNRKTTLVALGGGVIGDMTGFAAAAYQRGVNFIQVPTTLLSQVDSSVGGKTGVNHALGKNMIGAFYQPRSVIIDTQVLATLPDRELSAGLAEVIKYGLIADIQFLEWLELNLERLLARDSDALAYAIEVSCKTKAWVVSQDEHESGIRAILNLGHTFGHAIESSQGYGVWVHGEAVGAGMVMAADLSNRLGWIDHQFYRRVVNLIKAAGLPIAPPKNMTPEVFLSYMSVDKKVLDGSLRLVLLREPGKAVVTEDFPAELLQQTLMAF
ncbi:3-dehydroquinate synthase [Teredinibacter waterburyi]|uniref:3-dehydroquinate synthase n=1 Tax=Teredinibacter waterburyi TaxID=1500538 RepID=UPI00165FB111|nr:3-dehydroquinate synthase [Teredinibacter waterburyi]